MKLTNIHRYALDRVIVRLLYPIHNCSSSLALSVSMKEDITTEKLSVHTDDN